MDIIKVLALDDDNHEISYITEKGEYFYGASSFMKNCLLKPHANTYKVREIVLINIEENTEQVDEWFNTIQFGLKENSSLKEFSDWAHAFAQLWKIGDENNYV